MDKLDPTTKLNCSVCAKEKKVTDHWDVMQGFIPPELFMCGRCRGRSKNAKLIMKNNWRKKNVISVHERDGEETEGGS